MMYQNGLKFTKIVNYQFYATSVKITDEASNISKTYKKWTVETVENNDNHIYSLENYIFTA